MSSEVLQGILIKRWWPERELNPRHEDFQSSALPTELSGQNDRVLEPKNGVFVKRRMQDEGTTEIFSTLYKKMT